MADVPMTRPPAPVPAVGWAARVRAGGLMLAIAAALNLLSLLVFFFLPAPSPTDTAGLRAARVESAAAAYRAIGALGIVRALGLALACALLAGPPRPAAPVSGPADRRRVTLLAWRLMLLAAALFLAVDLFNTFALVPLARGYAAHPGLYEFAEKLEFKIVGVAALCFSIAALAVFAVEIAPHHRRIGSGWIAFGIVAGAVGIPGAVGVIANLPRLGMLFIVAYLAFIPLLRLGVRIAAGAPDAIPPRRSA